MAPAPWYREPWPWLLMAGPAAVVAASAVTLFLAFHDADGLVAEDYYTRGLAINRELAREAYALRAGLSARIQWSPESGRLALRFRGGSPADFPAALSLTLLHPVRAALDRRLELARTAPGLYTAQLAPLGRHRWVVKVECAQWRLDGEWKDPAQQADIAATGG